MRKPEQNPDNYGMNPQNRNRNSMGTGKGINRNNFNNNYDQYSTGARSSEWNNTDEHFSFDHDNNFDTSSKYNDYNSSFNDSKRGSNSSSSRGFNSNHNTDFDDEGLESRSHRMSSDVGQQGKTGHYGKGPKGYRRSDERIKEDVCECLYAHSEIDASSIEVSVKEGAVTLSGTVESRELKRLVETEIENLSGVDDIQNNLKVAKASSTGSSSTTPMGNSTSIRNQKLA